VSVSTNGLRLLERPDLLSAMRQRQVVVSLQFDGFEDRGYQVLRGRKLATEKRAILERLAEADVSTSLTVTAAGGVNEDQFPAILDYFFAQPHVVSMMVQPTAFVGRGRELAGRATRLTIPDVVGLLAQSGTLVSRPRTSSRSPAPSVVHETRVLPGARQRAHRADPAVGRCVATARLAGESHDHRPGPTGAPKP